MLKEIPDSDTVLALAKDMSAPTIGELSRRVSEASPGIASWLIILAPIWLTLIDPRFGYAFVSAFVLYFVVRGTLFSIRSLLNRPCVLAAMKTDWLAKLEQDDEPDTLDWRDCSVTFLIRAYREGNLDMLRDTVGSIYRSNWPRAGRRMQRVEVVFATEQNDPITPPLVERLADEFRDKLAIRQIRHPYESGTLPGPSTAMHYVGRVMHMEAMRLGIDAEKHIVADLDADTILHPQYLPCLMYRFVTDSLRQTRVYQPLVAFTTNYWDAPLHSRLSAIGTTALTLSWNRRPEIAFTGAAASLALLKSVDFWPTNSHSQDSGIDFRLRLRYGRRYRVVGLPIPAFVYPVMAVSQKMGPGARRRAYLNSYRVLFRQSARWREGPLDEFVEGVRHKHFGLILHRLWNGLERDTLTIIPGSGYLVVRAVDGLSHASSSALLPGINGGVFGVGTTIGLSLASAVGLVVFWLLLDKNTRLVPKRSFRRLALELVAFWVMFFVYVPILTGVAGLKTATSYLLGWRPVGHFVPTPK